MQSAKRAISNLMYGFVYTWTNHTLSCTRAVIRPMQQNSYTFGYMSLVLRKPVVGVSDQIRHKSGCNATQDGLRLEISDLESKGIVLSV